MPAGQTDPNLTNFSINHDTAYIIPVIQQALSINPGMKTVATTWSAPAWMKVKLSLYGGNFNTHYDSVLANYYVKFLQAYKTYGIPVTWVSPQNEPRYCPYPTSYPTDCIADTPEATIIGQHLGPAIQAAGLTTQIHVFDHNWLEYSYALNVLSDPTANSYSAGTSFHCYRGSPSDMLNV